MRVKLHRSLPKYNEDSYAHFVTTRTHQSRPYFGNGGCCRLLVEQLEFYSERYGFALVGYVITPDHFHLIAWWDVEDKPDLSISRVMNSIKTMTAKRIKRYLSYDGGLAYTSRVTDVGHPTPSPFRLWQRGFYDFNIYGEDKLLEKLNYVYNNPVKVGLVALPEEYEWSSWKCYCSEKMQRQ